MVYYLDNEYSESEEEYDYSNIYNPEEHFTYEEMVERRKKTGIM